MKRCEEMVESLNKRREQYWIQQRKKRTYAIRAGASLCCVCLTALIGIGLWRNGVLQRTPKTEPDAAATQNSVPQSTEAPNTSVPADSKDQLGMPDGPILWRTDGVQTGDSWVQKTVQWNGKNVTESLYAVLTDPNNADAVIALAASFSLDEEFEYCGKTISQYAAEANEERVYHDKLWGLLKDGDSLKYGEALYLTGAPNGEKWAQSLYEETIAEYGEDFLATYIVDGEFLREKVEQDLAMYEEFPLFDAYRAAENAFYEHAFTEARKKLNVYCERSWNGWGIVIYATAEQFAASSPLDYVSGYWWADRYGEYALGVSSDIADDLSK